MVPKFDSDNISEELSRLALELHKIGAVKFGEFHLKFGGILSPFYFDLREAGAHIDIFLSAAKLVNSIPVLNTENALAVCGVPMAAIPLATFIACERRIPFLLCRQERKDHGTGKLIEGTLAPGTKCLLVDDVCSSGNSILEIAHVLRDAGFIVTDAVVFLDRESGGEQTLVKQGIKLHWVVNITQLCEILVNAGKLQPAQLETVRDFVINQRNYRMASDNSKTC